MILTPRDRQRLAFPLMAILPLPAAKSSTNAPRLRSASDPGIQFPPTPLAGLGTVYPCNIAPVSKDDIRELLLDAANRSASYIENLGTRAVRADRAAVERLREALDVPVPAEPSRAHEILAFLDERGSPATVASAGGRY